MGDFELIFIMLLTGLAAYSLERKVNWLTYFSAVCLMVLTALIFSTTGVVPSSSPVYDFFLGPMVPVILACMILGLDIQQIKKLPKNILGSFCVGVLGTTLGGMAAALIGAIDQGPDAAKLAAQLTASYIGGGENAVAMRTILDIPSEKFVACFALDNILTSVWMMVTVVGVKGDNPGKIRRIPSLSDEVTLIETEGYPARLVDFFTTFAAALGTTLLSRYISNTVGFFHPLVYLTVVALLIGQIPFIKKHLKQSYLIGSIAFAPFFFAMGAISNIHDIASIPKSMLLMPLIVVGVHALVIYIGSRHIVSRSEMAIASQSLIGGAGTAVALAQGTNWKEGISLGLILGTLGYIIANYIGLFVYSVSLKLIHLMGVSS